MGRRYLIVENGEEKVQGMMYEQYYSWKWWVVSVMLSSSVIATEPSTKIDGAYAADWECRAFNDGDDWLCRTSASSEYTVPLDTIAALRPSISKTFSALKQPKKSSSGHSVAVSTTSNVNDSSGESSEAPNTVNIAPFLSLSSDAGKLVMMLQREEAYTILWYKGSDKVEAAKMQRIVGLIEDSLLLISDRKGIKEYLIVSGLFPNEEAAKRDMSAIHRERSLAYLRPSPHQVRDLSSRTISLP